MLSKEIKSKQRFKLFSKLAKKIKFVWRKWWNNSFYQLSVYCCAILEHRSDLFLFLEHSIGSFHSGIFWKPLLITFPRPLFIWIVEAVISAMFFAYIPAELQEVFVGHPVINLGGDFCFARWKFHRFFLLLAFVFGVIVSWVRRVFGGGLEN